jgi:hypothetical protein
VEETKSAVEAHLHTAQELSLMRHSLADELSYLSQGFVSSFSDEQGKATLLEDIETLHRNLKELQTIKGYVQIIHRTLRLRYIFLLLFMGGLKKFFHSESAHLQFHSSNTISFASLTEYKALQDFVDLVSQASAQVAINAGERPPQLIKFVEGIRNKTWEDFKSSLST